MKKIKEFTKKHIFKITLFLCVLLFFVGYFITVSYVYPNLVDRAYFGDMFGGLAAIFSGLAFVGLIYTVFLQTEELKLQREELKLTKDEMKKSVEAQQKAGEALREQIKSMEKTANACNG